MTRKEKTARLVDNDIDDIRQALYNDDYGFLTMVLTGTHWVPYDNLSDDELYNEYQDRFADELIEEDG